MQDLIQISQTTFNGAEVNSVNAKDIYNFLGVKSRFNDWIKNRLAEFLIGYDYIIVTKKLVTESKDYFITLDTAKHLSMLERNDKGREARQYFIEVEKQANKPLSIEQLLKENIKVISRLQNQVIEMKPKALFADSVAQSTNSILIGEFAKLISDETFKIGQNKLFDWFRTNNYLCSTGSKYNQPCQKYIDNGYFETIERTISNPNGSTRITITTKVTGLGQVKLTSKIKG